MQISLRQWCTGVALVLGCGTALAGSAVLSTGDGDTMRAEYLKDRLRIDPSQDEGDGTMIVRDGKLYVIAANEVFEVGSLKQMVSTLSGLFGQANASPDLSRFVGLNATSRRETIAGIEGRVHELVFEDAKGQRQTEELVLTKDQRARELTDALQTLLAAQDLVDTAELAQLTDALDGQGVLRMGKEMTVASFGPDPDPKRFELPGTPQPMPSLGGLGALFGGGGAAGGALPGGIDPGRMLEDIMKGQNLSPDQQKMMQDMMKSLGGR